MKYTPLCFQLAESQIKINMLSFCVGYQLDWDKEANNKASAFFNYSGCYYLLIYYVQKGKKDVLCGVTSEIQC